MAIDQTLQNDEISSVSTPSAQVSDIVVENPSHGSIVLQVKTPNGGWVNLTDREGAYSVSTPDTALEYRFVAKNVDKPARVYMT